MQRLTEIFVEVRKIKINIKKTINRKNTKTTIKSKLDQISRYKQEFDAHKKTLNTNHELLRLLLITESRSLLKQMSEKNTIQETEENNQTKQ